MVIKRAYNHLNAREYLLVNKPVQYEEIRNAVLNVNANDFLKISCDISKLGQVFYSQTKINVAIKEILNADGWTESRVNYYVTGDEATTRDIVHIKDQEEQRRIIEQNGFISYSTFNQVDFQKDRIAVEVQFGKYFSVAYDLHVKHTFFFARNDIDVGIEIIPTKAMEEHMDTGVPWFENEVTNVIREGRTNPPVPILILGIQPDHILTKDPTNYTDDDLISILHHSDIGKYREKVAKCRVRRNGISEELRARFEKIDRCLAQMGV